MRDELDEDGYPVLRDHPHELTDHPRDFDNAGPAGVDHAVFEEAVGEGVLEVPGFGAEERPFGQPWEPNPMAPAVPGEVGWDDGGPVEYPPEEYDVLGGYDDLEEYEPPFEYPAEPGDHYFPDVEMAPAEMAPAEMAPAEPVFDYHAEIEALQARGVTQDRTGMPWGTCMEAAWATILGVPLEALPDLREIAEIRGASSREIRTALKYRREFLQRFVADELGALAVWGPGSRPPVLKAKLAHERQMGYKLPPLFWVASGPGPRGNHHAVVYADEQLAWDPHPHRTGLNSVAGWTVFVPIGLDEYGWEG